MREGGRGMREGGGGGGVNGHYMALIRITVARGNALLPFLLLR